jgi:hypothetical protein
MLLFGQAKMQWVDLQDNKTAAMLGAIHTESGDSSNSTRFFQMIFYD